MSAATHTLLGKLDGVRAVGERKWEARCPAHKDNRASLSVTETTDGTVLVHCHANCETNDVLANVGMKLADLFPRNGQANGHTNVNGESRIVATYNYRDGRGKMCFQVVRFDPKDFRQRQPQGNDWKWSVKDCPIIPYRLPELLQSDDTYPVFVCEGEKDCDRLAALGLVATCNAGGAGKWRIEHTTFVAGRHVVIISDNDASGRKHANQVAESVAKAAASVKVVDLDVPDKGDVSDWLDAGGTADRLIEIAEQSPTCKPPAPQPKLDAAIKDLAVITPLAWQALQQANHPPQLFRYGGVASRIEAGDEGEPIVKALDYNRMRHHLARSAQWIKQAGDKDEERPAAPPKDVVCDVLATPNHPLPLLTRIVEAPVCAADGTLQTTHGYHPASQTYYAPAAGFSVPSVSQQPEAADVEAARTLIVDELLGDFPFVGDAEIAHAVAILLLPFARGLIDGPTPLHLIEKPSPGTGATLLVDVLSLPATGRPIATMTEGRDEDEWRKRITAKLRSGSTFLLIDNLRRRLNSAAVSAGITSTTWEDRLLTTSEMTRLPVRCVWLATGNNPAVSTEIARRTIRIRLDAKLDRPWLREGFRHQNLRQWASKYRGELVWAALTLTRAWVSAGRPPGTKTIGMFERWSEVIGGILCVAGIPGFLTNLEDFYEESDAEGSTWRAFLALWWEQFSDREITVKELWQVANSQDIELSLGDKGEQSQRIKLGTMLSGRRDRVYDINADGQPLRLSVQRGNQFRRAYRWRLRAMG